MCVLYLDCPLDGQTQCIESVMALVIWPGFDFELASLEITANRCGSISVGLCIKMTSLWSLNCKGHPG